MRGRQSEQVAKRALILATISFRASLEVTDHPRVVELTNRLLPWLIEIACDDELDVIERELLQTSFGQLSHGQQVDAKSAGEAAMVFCWMLGKAEQPLDGIRVDSTILPTLLPILRPEAGEFVKTVSLRDPSEILRYCVRVSLIRSMLQECRIPEPQRQLLRRINVQRLNEIGIETTLDEIESASSIVERMTEEERHCAGGFHFVREHAVRWFYSDRGTYFESDDPPC